MHMSESSDQTSRLPYGAIIDSEGGRQHGDCRKVDADCVAARCIVDWFEKTCDRGGWGTTVILYFFHHPVVHAGRDCLE